MQSIWQKPKVITLLVNNDVITGDRIRNVSYEEELKLPVDFKLGVDNYLDLERSYTLEFVVVQPAEEPPYSMVSDDIGQVTLLMDNFMLIGRATVFNITSVIEAQVDDKALLRYVSGTIRFDGTFMAMT